MPFSFSTRLDELYKNSNNGNGATVFGHAKFGGMKACAESVKNGGGNHPPLVRGKPGRRYHHNHSRTLSFVKRYRMAVLLNPWCQDHHRWRDPDQLHPTTRPGTWSVLLGLAGMDAGDGDYWLPLPPGVPLSKCKHWLPLPPGAPLYKCK